MEKRFKFMNLSDPCEKFYDNGSDVFHLTK